MQIENIARESFAPRWTAQQQRNFAVGRGMLRKIVVNTQRVPLLSRKNSPIAQPEYGAMYCIGAGSEAVAATTIVYSIAPCSSSVLTTCATVDRFCPIAT